MSFTVKPTFLGKILRLKIKGLTADATIDWNDPFDTTHTNVSAPGGVVEHDYGSGGAGSAFVVVTSGAEYADIAMWLSDFTIMNRSMVSAMFDGAAAEFPLDVNWWWLPIDLDEVGFTVMCYGHPISFMSAKNTGRGAMAPLPPSTFDNTVTSSQ